ncbi:MAG: mechanosensitive ion channel family protein [Oscillospiraceae bacterium]
MVERFVNSFYNFFSSAYIAVADNIMEILVGTLVFLLFVLVSKQLEKFAVNIVGKLFHNRDDIKDGIQSALLGPLKVFFRLLGAYIGIKIVGFPVGIMVTIKMAFRISTIIIVAWASSKFMPFVTSLIIKSNQKSNRKTNAVAVTFLANILKAIIFAIAGVIVIGELGYNINGLLAGIGLGGLTFSLAAQKTAANIFSGFSIISDKTFDVGDRISTSTIDGVVEDITMRSTRIRTMADTIVIVPNAVLVEQPITNWSRMKKRIVDFKIGLTYDTSVKTVRKVVEKIKEMLKEHPDVHKGRITVCFEEFSESSLQIRIMYFTKTTDYDKYLAINDEINIKIKEIVEKEKASFAFPSTSIYLENKQQ